jgi:hypothetical protein
MTFSETYKNKSQLGKTSLRRMQFRLAEKNSSMAIWLGKQYLNQKDAADVTLPADKAKDDALSQSLRAMAEELESDQP